MKYRLAKFFLIIGLLLSIYVLLVLLHIVSFKNLEFLLLGYLFWMLFTIFISYFSLMIAASQKPKEIVKVVYKEVPKEPTKKEQKVDKERQIIQKYTQIVLKDLEKYEDSLNNYIDHLFENLSEAFKIVVGMFFIWDKDGQVYKTAGTYALYREDNYKEYKLGEGITGQVAKDKRVLYIDNVPENYIIVYSGLIKGTPKYLVFLPIIKNDFTVAVVEFATFEALPEPTLKILENLSNKLSEQFPDFVKI